MDVPSLADIMTTMDYSLSSQESLDPLKEWLSKHESVYLCGRFINNNWERIGDQMKGVYKLRIEHTDVIVSFEYGTEKDINEAVIASMKALATWNALEYCSRAMYIKRISEYLEKNKTVSSLIETICMKKPFHIAGDLYVPAAINAYRQVRNTSRKALGVVGIILNGAVSLFNLSRRLSAALSVGNTVVIVTNSENILPVYLITDACKGLPPGVVNVVMCDISVQQRLVLHEDVSLLTYDGLFDRGCAIRKDVGIKKPILLDLCSNYCTIIFDSADCDSAIEEILVLLSQIQNSCKVLIQQSTWATFIRKLKYRWSTLRAGVTVLDKGVDVVPIRKSETNKKYLELIQQARQEGAEILEHSTTDENVVYPMAVISCDTESRCVTEYIGIPLLTLIPFRTLREAIRLCKDDCWGNTASIWSENIAVALETARKLKVARVFINQNPVPDATIPYSPLRLSGVGIHGGDEELLFYTRSESNKDSSSIKKDVTSRMEPLPNVTESVLKNPPISAKVHTVVQNAFKVQELWEQQDRQNLHLNVVSQLIDEKQKWIDVLHNNCGLSTKDAENDFTHAIEMLVKIKWNDTVMTTSILNNYVMVTKEPVGCIAIGCLEETKSPLLDFISISLLPISKGNCVIIVANEIKSIIPMQLAKLFSSCGVPSGVMNVISGDEKALLQLLKDDQLVQAVWFPEGTTDVKPSKFDNMKDILIVDSNDCVHLCTKLKQIWMHYGDSFAN